VIDYQSHPSNQTIYNIQKPAIYIYNIAKKLFNVPFIEYKQ